MYYGNSAYNTSIIEYLGGTIDDINFSKRSGSRNNWNDCLVVVLFAVMYFLMIRPQKKEQKKKELMLNEVATGDTVLTTSGFYGTVIDIEDDTVIVEFGNNKNCRIPMQKAAIADLEKAEDSAK